MAGSWDHITTKNGKFRGTALIDNLGDAHEALEECFGMVWYLAEARASMLSAGMAPNREQILRVIKDAAADYKQGVKLGGVTLPDLSGPLRNPAEMNEKLKAAGLPELICDVCHNEPAVGVAAVPGVPVSMAYGGHCLAANAHPYGILVINTAMCGGYDHTSEWWRQMVDDTLHHLGKDREQFDLDVEAEMADQRAAPDRWIEPGGGVAPG